NNDAHRPPTKQFVETLRVKIHVLEEEISRLQSASHRHNSRTAGPNTASSEDGVSPGNETRFPSHSRLATPDDCDSRQQSPRTATNIDETGQPLHPAYQFIFNINPSAPPHENPEAVRQSLACDWSRHLPPLDGTQFTRLEHDTLLDRCFKYSTCWLMSIISHFFLHDMLHALAHPHERSGINYYSPLLHCALLAFAAALSDHPAMKQRQTKEKFAERAKQLLHEELHRPSLSLVHALAILSEYHAGIGEREPAYMYLGMSIRAVRARESATTIMQFKGLTAFQFNLGE
ncbi:hypothetical protein FRC07_003154, partial [Ceratobasidium sp. 392]